MLSRSLSPIEALFYWRTAGGDYTNFCVAGDYTHTLNEEQVRATLRIMCDEFPNLRSNIVRGANNKPTLVYIKDVDYSETLKVVNNPTWAIEDALMSVQDEKFVYGDNKPLWRCVLFNGTTLLFYTDHVLCDGMSGVNFHRVFKEKYASHNGKHVVGLLPSPHALVAGYYPSFLTRMGLLFMELAPRFITKWIHYLFDQYRDLSYVEQPRQEKERSITRILSYDAATVSDILDMCRAHNVKLTAFLAHVGLLAAQPFSGAYDTKTVVPTNARPLMHPNVEQDTSFGLFMGHVDFALPTMAKINPTGFNWDVTRRIHATIHDNYPRSCYDLGLLDFVDPQKVLKQGQTGPNGATLEVSNLGKIPLANAWFDQQVVQTLFGMSVVCGTETLNVSIRSLRAAHLDTFYASVVHIIQDLLAKHNQ